MASVIFNNAITRIQEGDLVLDAAGMSIRLCMSNVAFDKDNTTVGAGTIDECDATGYPAGGLTITTPAVDTDDVNDRSDWKADDVSFSGLSGDATRDYSGAVIVEDVDGGANDIPIIYIEFSNAPIAKEATQVDVPLSSDIWRAAQG